MNIIFFSNSHIILYFLIVIISLNFLRGYFFLYTKNTQIILRIIILIIIDNGEDAILAEGMEKYCEDLKVDPEDVVMIILSMHLNATRMCEYKKDDFITGWCNLK